MDLKLFLCRTERRLQPARRMTGVMYRGSAAPLAQGVHADAVLLGQLPVGALACYTAKRVAGVVVAFLRREISMAAPWQRFAILPELLGTSRGLRARDACF